MYNIHSHYNFLFELLKSKNTNSTVAYLYPFGSTLFEDLEFLRNSSDDLEVILFCYDQEPIYVHYNRSLFDKIQNLKTFDISSSIQIESTGYSNYFKKTLTLRSQEISHKKIPSIILLNTEKDSLQKNIALAQYQFIDCYYFFHALAASDWFRGYEFCKSIIPIKQRRIKKTFISMNRILGNSRIYRSFFIAELRRKNLLDFGHISHSKICPVHGNLQPSIIKSIKKYNLNQQYILDLVKELNDIKELRIDTPIDKQIYNQSFSIGPISESIESFVHVVTETCFWEEKKHLTEKIFKPIVLKQPFILLGCANNLAYLKEYGFKTFDQWWDESYDLCQDPIQRINQVVCILETLCQMSNDELTNMLYQMEEVLEYNYNRFYSKEFVQDIWSELETNLESAIAQLLPPTSPGT